MKLYDKSPGEAILESRSDGVEEVIFFVWDHEDPIHSNFKHALKNCATPNLDLDAIVCYVDASSAEANELRKFFPITTLPAIIRLRPDGQVKPGMQGQDIISLSAHDLVYLLESTPDSYDNFVIDINIKFQDGTHFTHSTTQAARLRDVYAAVDEYCREKKKAGFNKYVLVKPGQAGGGIGNALLDRKLVHLKYFSMNCSLIVQPTSTPGCYVSPNPYIPPPPPKKKNSVPAATTTAATEEEDAGGEGSASTFKLESLPKPSIADNNTISLCSSGYITISIKLPDGTSLKANFCPEDTTLQQVRHHIDTHRQDTAQPEGAYRLVCGPFPKRVLDDDDDGKGSSTLTLAELCIGDRSTMIVEPVEWTKPRAEKGGWWSGWWLWGGNGGGGDKDGGGEEEEKKKKKGDDKNEYWNGNSTVFGGDDGYM